MKQCPHCRTTYTDDTLLFCLQDGTPLAPLRSSTDQPTVAWNEPETVVRQRAGDWQPSQVTQIQPAPKKSNTALAVGLTAFVMLLLFGGGLGAWLLLRNRGDVPVNSKVDNPANVSNAAKISPSPTASPKASPTPTGSANANQTTTPPPPPAVNPEQVKSEVSDRVFAWKSALESGSLDSFMSNYADRLDYYYNSRNVAGSAVRGDKQRAFALYDDFKVKISNLRVTPEAGGERATAVFDKEWEFEGADHYSAGKVQSQLQLTKSGGKWYVSGERDLKLYYKE